MSIPDIHLQRPVLTFYSYKGGVGRSMAVANVAVLLARDYGLSVIVIDWDLEAPGLHRFFQVPDERVRDGLIDYVERFKRWVRQVSDRPVDPPRIEKSLIMVREYHTGGTVRLLAAGKLLPHEEYAGRVNNFDWDDFYRDWNGAQCIEFLRQSVKNLADVTIVDSRTGITDVGGICTLQMPDIVVLTFAFNEQNLSGTFRIAQDLSGGNLALKALDRRPEILLLPARKELSEIGTLRQWERRAAEALEPFVKSDRIRSRFTTALEYIRATAVQYVPYFAYGEELAVETEKGVEMTRPLRLLVQMILGEVTPPLSEDRRVLRVNVMIAQFVTLMLIVSAAFSRVPENIQGTTAMAGYIGMFIGATWTLRVSPARLRRELVIPFGLISGGVAILIFINMYFVIDLPYLGSSLRYLIGFELTPMGRAIARTQGSTGAQLLIALGPEKADEIWGTSLLVVKGAYALATALIGCGLMPIFVVLKLGSFVLKIWPKIKFIG
jgi:hypothetical protein